MKKFETLVNEAKKLETVTIDNVTVTEESDILALLVFAEIKKALESKDCKVILDCNYSKSRTVDKEVSYNYYHVISTSKTFDNTLQLKRDSKNKLHFNISTKYIAEIEHCKNLDYKIKVNNKTKQVKNIRVNCTYETVQDTVKTLKAVLKTSADTSADTKAE